MGIVLARFYHVGPYWFLVLEIEVMRMAGPCLIVFIPGTSGNIIGTPYDLGMSDSVYPEIVGCDKEARGFPKIGLGCSTDRLVVVQGCWW